MWMLSKKQRTITIKCYYYWNKSQAEQIDRRVELVKKEQIKKTKWCLRTVISEKKKFWRNNKGIEIKFASGEHKK